ncbi:MAG: hypothetical protein Alpg2KO_31280 [Alphaproteobacteria bacterium]
MPKAKLALILAILMASTATLSACASTADDRDLYYYDGGGN